MTNQLLGDLLAVIHQDGGQYRHKHGTRRAAEDAAKVVYQLRAEVDKWKALATRRGARMQIIRDWLDTPNMLGSPSEWWYFCEERPEAETWFDADGVPVSEEVEK